MLLLSNKVPRRKQRGIKNTLQATGFQPAIAQRGEELNPKKIELELDNPAIAEIFEGFRDKPCDSGDILILDDGINSVPNKAKCVDDRDDPIKARQISDNLAARKDNTYGYRTCQEHTDESAG